MDAIQVYLNRCACLFLAASTALTSLPAGAAWTLDVPKVLKTAIESDVPVDPRDLTEYLKSNVTWGSRTGGAMLYFSSTPAAQTFDDLMKSLRENNPRLLAVLKERNVSENSLRQFYSDTYLLLQLLKRKRGALAEHQFEAFRINWELVDYRLLPSAEMAQQYSQELRELFVSAFLEAGPWSAEQIVAVDQFLRSKAQWNEKKWYSNFRKRLRNQVSLSQYSTVDPEIAKRSGWAGKLGYIIGTPLSFGTATGFMLAMIKMSTDYGLDFSTGATGLLLTVVAAVSTLGVFFGTNLGMGYGFGTTPATHLFERKLISDMLSLGPLSCEEIMLEKDPP